MSYPVMPLGFLGSQGDNDTYRIERSLRFNSADSAYLNRTPASAGNRKTWTWSGWVKRGALSDGVIFIGDNGSSSFVSMAFDANNISLAAFSGAGNPVWGFNTSAVFRDPSAWYHIVFALDTTQSTASLRARLYVNGTEQTVVIRAGYPSATPAQNTDYSINSAIQHRIGASLTGTYFDGYLTEINFIDGQALTPSSFGETDAITGRWKAKAYSGTYGTNGFYLKFADNSGTTATTLGKDSSGNGNNWTPNNFSVTAGAGNDSLVDSPTNYGTDTGVGGEVRGNYCVANILDRNSNISVSNGGLLISTSAAGTQQIRASMAFPQTGKWYWETTNSGSSNNFNAGITQLSASLSVEGAGDLLYNEAGNIINNGVTTGGYPSLALNDIMGLGYDVDANKLYFYKNNTLVNAGGTTPSASGPFAPMFGMFGSGNAQNINFGQRPFAYTAPTGFKALCTTNLPTPTIKKPSSYMDVALYTGNGSSQTISSLGFSPDLLIHKQRSAAGNHIVYDLVRGANYLLTNSTASEVSSGVIALNSSGFSVGLGTDVNVNGNTYVAWAWDEAPIAGMDIVSYTGTGVAGRTVAHSLGVAPKMIIVKSRNDTQNWWVYHSSQNASPANGALLLNSTAAFATDSNYWNNTNPTSSVFSVGTYHASGNNYIAYLFAEVEGFSKFGSYTGNGSADGPFVWCGFRPRWVMAKKSSAAGDNWFLHDTARSVENVSSQRLRPSTADAEDTGFTVMDILSNGFKTRSTDTSFNGSGATFIFAAFAESPFKYARAR